MNRIAASTERAKRPNWRRRSGCRTLRLSRLPAELTCSPTRSSGGNERRQHGINALADPLTVWVRAYVDERNLSRRQRGATFALPPPTVVLINLTTAKIGFVSPTAEFTPKPSKRRICVPSCLSPAHYRHRCGRCVTPGMPVTVKFNDGHGMSEAVITRTV